MISIPRSQVELGCLIKRDIETRRGTVGRIIACKHGDLSDHTREESDMGWLNSTISGPDEGMNSFVP